MDLYSILFLSNRQLVAAAAVEENSCEFGSGTYYAYCGLGGLLSCGITHTLVTPLDLVKCRLQVIIIYWTHLQATVKYGGDLNNGLVWYFHASVFYTKCNIFFQRSRFGLDTSFVHCMSNIQDIIIIYAIVP